MVRIGGLLDYIDEKLKSIADTDERNAKREEFIDMANCAIDYAEEKDIGKGTAPNWTTDAEDLEIFNECVTDVELMPSPQTDGTK